MGGVISSVTDAIGLTDSDAGADAARDASNVQAQAQREALEYLKEREAVPREFQEGALGLIGGMYGLGDNQDATSALQSSPLYQATIGQLPMQEEAILRSASATGALRTSGTEAMLAENQRQNQLQAYQNAMAPLSGLAGLPSYAPQIAQGMAGIGQTQAQGIIGAAQSQQAAQQAGMSNLMGMGQLGLAAFSAFCDPSLKDNAKKIGEVDGYNIYHWIWNDKAAELGLFGEGVGPMADEVQQREPERVEIRNGYRYVKPRAA